MAGTKDCPKCGLLNPATAGRCDCGWDFTTSRQKRSHLKSKNSTKPQKNKYSREDKYRYYEDVPFYRQQWFFWLCFFCCGPVAFLILASGDVYYKKEGRVVPFGMANRVIAVVVCLSWIGPLIIGILFGISGGSHQNPSKPSTEIWPER
jgi:hypothetical protein